MEFYYVEMNYNASVWATKWGWKAIFVKVRFCLFRIYCTYISLCNGSGAAF
jgi:hypothetical protein